MASRFLCFMPVFLLGLSACSGLLPENNRVSAADPPPDSIIQADSVFASTDQPTMLASSQPVTGIQVTQLADLVETDLWQSLRERFALQVPDNERVRSHRKRYASHPEYIDRVTGRAELYLQHIHREIRKRDMPSELALLPIVESAFDPFAYSHGRAAGLWQFIPTTGKRFGLRQNWWYDGRRDLIDSTSAALDYLQYLHKRFDRDWLLALAAYNSGEGTVSKALRHNRNNSLPTDFWSLNLPKETRAYVPKLLALKQLVSDPKRWGVRLTPISGRPTFEIINTGGQIDLAVAADLAGLPLDTLYRFNPGYNQWATDPDGPFRLLIPVENAQRFRLNLSTLPAKKRIRWERHKVRSGETLSGIAVRYHTTLKALQSVNELKGSIVRTGSYLLVPISSEVQHSYSLSAGQRLSRTQDKSRGSNQRIEHIVRRGDNLWDLSRHYKVGLKTLAKSNGMAPGDTLRIGQKLVIWSKTKDSGDNRVRPVHYTVRKGDSLSRISQRFKVTVTNLRAWNSLQKNRYLQPGQKLKLYVDVTRQAEST